MEYRKFVQGDRTYVRAQQAWQILSSYVIFRQNDEGFGEGLISYKALGKWMGINGQNAGLQTIPPVKHIFRFCQANDLPLLSAMVVTRKSTKNPGWDYEVSEETMRDLQDKVLAFDWFSIRTPTSANFKAYPLKDYRE